MINFEQDILDKLKLDFGSNYEVAFNQLKAYANRFPEIRSRIFRCIVYVADGNLKELKDAIDLATLDWRDIIMWAEYEGDNLQSAVRVRNFNQPFELK